MDLYQEMITQHKHRCKTAPDPPGPQKELYLYAPLLFFFPFGISTYSPRGFGSHEERGWRCFGNKQPPRSSTAYPHILPRLRQLRDLPYPRRYFGCHHLSVQICSLSDSQVLPQGRNIPPPLTSISLAKRELLATPVT